MREQKEEEVKSLLAAYERVNSKNSKGRTPLHLAVGTGNLGIINELLLYGASIQQTDKKGDSPLTHAINNNNVEVVAMFVKHSKAQLGRALHLAAEFGRAEIVNELIVLGADVEAMNPPSHRTLVQISKEKPLHKAITCGHLEVVQILVRAGASLEATNDLGEAPLHLAVEAGNIEVVKELIRNLTANGKREVLDARTPAQETPLHRAARHGRADMVQVLVTAGCNLNAKSSFGTPLHQAAKRGSYETVEELLQLGADVSARKGGRKTPFDVAMAHGRKKTAALLKRYAENQNKAYTFALRCTVL